MSERFVKETLKVVVGQICQTIGWNSINSSVMDILIDVLRRYLSEIAKTTHNFADLFGRTRPNMDDLGLAFSEMGIELGELREYVEFVESVPCSLAVPKFPIFKETHLNFLKPGSKEVVTRPVHVNEHLPPTIELTVETNTDLTNSPQPSPTFKRPGDPVEGAIKRPRLCLEEEGRPLREISSVMMTTGGFISPAREGKLPEPKWTLPASDLRSHSPPAPHYPNVPQEVFREKKKRPPEPVKQKEKSKKIKRSSSSGTKKLANMKEVSKLKAFKPNPNKTHSPHSHRAPPPHTPEKTLIQKLAESPHLVVTPVPSDPPPPVVKLVTEPDKQKLNIFKKISKAKEEEPPPVKEIETSVSSPGSPPTPKTPDIIRSPEHKKKKKDKEKKKKKQDRVRPEPFDLDRRPKTPEIMPPTPTFPQPFPFFPHGLIPPAIANPLIPRFPVPLGPNFPNLPLPPAHFMQPGAKSESITEPSASTSKSPLAILLDREKKGKEHKKEKKEKKKKDRKDKPKKDKKEKRHGEEKHRSKDKKEKKEKRKEKEREREREKEKEKEREREKEKEREREKEKEREREKEKEREREKEKEREREKEREKAKEKIKEEASVPKLTLKIASNSSSPRPSSPRRSAKTEDEPRRSAPKPVEVEEPKRPSTKTDAAEPRAEGSSEIARISSLFNKPSKSETKPLHVQTESLKIPKDNPLQKSPGTIIDQDGNKVWICPACGKPDDGTPMIGCDECDAWYHWICVGIHEAPHENDDWYCRFCIVKKQGSSGKKKRGRKKKPQP